MVQARYRTVANSASSFSRRGSLDDDELTVIVFAVDNQVEFEKVKEQKYTQASALAQVRLLMETPWIQQHTAGIPLRQKTSTLKLLKSGNCKENF